MNTSEPPATPRNTDHVQSLERGLAVIRAFDGEAGPLSLSEVARRCDLTRATARRFLLTLVNVGYVSHDGRDFALRPRVLELGVSFLSGLSFLDVARPHLERVSQAVDESASIAVLDDDEIVYVARVPTRRIMSVTIAVGTRFPAVVTSMGRVLLAALPEDEVAALIARAAEGGTVSAATAPGAAASASAGSGVDSEWLRAAITDAGASGYALADQELEVGLRSVAVPIHDEHGMVVAAMNVATHAARRTTAELRGEILPRLEAAAESIRADIVRVRMAGGGAGPRD